VYRRQGAWGVLAAVLVAVAATGAAVGWMAPSSLLQGMRPRIFRHVRAFAPHPTPRASPRHARPLSACASGMQEEAASRVDEAVRLAIEKRASTDVRQQFGSKRRFNHTRQADFVNVPKGMERWQSG